MFLSPPSIKLHLTICTACQDHGKPLYLRCKIYLYTPVQLGLSCSESHSCSPQPVWNRDYNLCGIHHFSVGSSTICNTETKQVTALSISNLRLIIQDHFLIKPVFHYSSAFDCLWTGLFFPTICYLVFSQAELLCSCQLWFWPIFHWSESRSSLLELWRMLDEVIFAVSVINCHHTSLSSSSVCNTA